MPQTARASKPQNKSYMPLLLTQYQVHPCPWSLRRPLPQAAPSALLGVPGDQSPSSAGGPGLWKNRANIDFLHLPTSSYRKGSHCLQMLKTIIFSPPKYGGKNQPAPGTKVQGGGVSENSQAENREEMIQHRPDLLEANTHHQLHFCGIATWKADSKNLQKE